MNSLRLPRYAFVGALIGTGLLGEIFWADKSKALESSTSNNPLPDHLLAWDALSRETNVQGYADSVQFVFNVTNVSTHAIVIQAAASSCGCTTPQLPALPWVIPAAGSGQLGATVKLVGKARKQTESIAVFTDAGFQVLKLQVTVSPPIQPPRSTTERAQDREIERHDQQAIFQGVCAECHVKPGDGKDGKALYYAVCAICHEGTNPVQAAPDLFAIHTPTNVSFWIDGIAHGKPGSFMPAFSTKDGGPLSEGQIANLARFLNTADNLDAP